MHTCAHTCTHICIHMYANLQTHMYTHLHTCTHTCTYMYTHMHTHVHTLAHRILAFSPHPIVSVEVWLNGKLVSMATPVNGGPLFVLPWQPDLYMKGTHSIYVNVKVSFHCPIQCGFHGDECDDGTHRTVLDRRSTSPKNSQCQVIPWTFSSFLHYSS